MPTELFWLTLTTIMTGLLWVPYILDRSAVRGLVGSMANPHPDDRPQSAWAQRQMRAHANAVENLVIFAILVLIAHAIGSSTPATAIASAVYFWARLAHFIIYSLGIPVLRSLSFLVAFGAQAVFALTILKLI